MNYEEDREAIRKTALIRIDLTAWWVKLQEKLKELWQRFTADKPDDS